MLRTPRLRVRGRCLAQSWNTLRAPLLERVGRSQSHVSVWMLLLTPDTILTSYFLKMSMWGHLNVVPMDGPLSTKGSRQSGPELALRLISRVSLQLITMQMKPRRLLDLIIHALHDISRQLFIETLPCRQGSARPSQSTVRHTLSRNTQ